MTTFTRYLYLKEEVEVALLVSLLNKDKERALFWAYELYYSGLANELIVTLWRIYYEFYAMLNPTFETYLKKKEKELFAAAAAAAAEEHAEGHLIGIIIHNLLIRKFTLDVFMLREVARKIEMDEDDANLTFEELLARNHYEAVAHKIVDTCKCLEDCEKLAVIACTYFKTQGIKNPKLLKELHVEDIHPCILLISRIMHYYAEVQVHKDKNGGGGGCIKMGKNLYLVVDAEEACSYKTMEATEELPPNKILQKAVLYSPADHGHNYSVLFIDEYVRAPTILHDYRCDWLYYAVTAADNRHKNGGVPIWQERVAKYGGQADDEAKRIIWEDPDGEELFYSTYGYDPEEQPIDILTRNIPPLDPSKNITWRAFYEKYAAGLPHLYVPHVDILEALE